VSRGDNAGASPVEVITHIIDWWESVPYPTLREVFVAADGFDDAMARFTSAGYTSVERWIAPDIEVGEAEIAGFTVLEPRRGRDQWMVFFRDFTEPWKDLRLDVRGYEQLDDELVLVDVGMSAEGASSGAEVTLPIYLLWVVREGQAAAYKPYAVRGEALAASRG
jgi:ketosteroid isomerase-like protein